MHGPYNDPDLFPELNGNPPKSEEAKRREKAWEKIDAKRKEKAERAEYERLHRKYGTF